MMLQTSSLSFKPRTHAYQYIDIIGTVKKIFWNPPTPAISMEGGSLS